MKFRKVIPHISLWSFILISIFYPCLSRGSEWHWRNPLPQGNDLNGVVFGNGIYAAVGISGTILTSLDGIDWVLRASGTGNSLEKVTFGNGIFVAVGSAGTILTSPDAITWTARASGTAAYLRGVIFGSGIFVVAGDDGTILTSPDGVNWASQASGITGVLTGVAHGNGVFVAAGSTTLTSTDGVNWAAGEANYFHDVTFGNGAFVAVASILQPGPPYLHYFTNRILTSPDGVNWTVTRDSAEFNAYKGVAFGGGFFVATRDDGAILTSPDGADWTVKTSGSSIGLRGIAFGNSSFVVVGVAGTILTSSDGDIWVVRSLGPVTHLRDVSFANNTFVAVGNSGTILTSPDGLNWTTRPSGTTTYLESVAFGNGTFAAVGYSGTILSSDDGIDWVLRASGTINTLGKVVFGNGAFVAVGNDGTVLTSPDGINWTARASGTAAGLGDVAFGGGYFVAVGNSAVLTSPDGVNWASQPIGIPSLIPTGVAFGNGIFVAVGHFLSQGFFYIILTSPDGKNWTPQWSTSVALPLLTPRVAFENNIFMMFGGMNGTILTSPDGVNWAPATVPAGIADMAFGNGTFVAVGAFGKILQSDPITFSDVLPRHWAEDQVIALYNSGITAGCGNGNYCPDYAITRGQMAVFLVASLGQSPVAPCTGRFFDVPVDHPFCGFVERMFGEGITGGCASGGLSFCPDEPVTRGQMAVFIETALGNPPDTCSGQFADVASDNPFCGFIERLAADGITGGCGGGNFCPNDPVTRAQMAVFLVAAPPPLNP